MRRLVRITAFALACGALISSSACTGQDGSEDPAALEGVEWHLTESSETSLNVDLTGITATFDGSRMSGSSGVNQFGGSYSANADGSFSAGPLVSTLMAGPEPLMRIEAAYLALLDEAESFSVEGDRLTLATGEGKTLTFRAASTPELSGSSWSVTAYNNGKEAVVSVAADSKLTLEFGADGQVSGNAGVNTFSGTYEYDGNTLSLGPLATTRMAGPQELMEQETLYLAALQASVSWEVVNGLLYLRDAEDALQVSAVAP
jgi:heat shock protein HslJ